MAEFGGAIQKLKIEIKVGGWVEIGGIVMKDKLIKWANAGDADSMYKLGEIYLSEQEPTKAAEYFEKSADTGYTNAMMKIAKMYRCGEGVEKDTDKAIDYYKKAASIASEIEALEALTELCDDEETLNFVESVAQKGYNETYKINHDILNRIMALGTRRHNECTYQYLQAIERRRIIAKARKMLG